MDKKKEEIYQHIYSLTVQQLQAKNLSSLGCDALNISIDLHMDRSNTSRLLNQLHHEGRLIKTQGRPTLFIARNPLENMDMDSYVPNVIPKGKTIIDYVHVDTIQDSPVRTDCFKEYIAKRNTSSMYDPIQKAKSALLYPPQGLHVLLYGEPCVGKLDFAKAIFQFGLTYQRFTNSSKFLIFDCMNFENHTTEEILGILYGYFDGKHLKKGMIEQAKNGLLVLHHLECLPFSTLTHIYNSMINQSISPIHLATKEYPIKCLIIGISNSDELISNPDIRRCFPMQIKLPSLREKSIQEMLVLTMQYFQKGCETMDKTIRISKGALSCFVMSEYTGNLPHLHAEIKQACAHAYYHYLEQESFFVNIDYDDISTPVLTDIYDVNERIHELDNILNLFENEFIFFSPLQKNEELELLYDLDDEVDKNDLHLHDIDDKLVNLCIQDINAAIHIQLNTIRSIMLKQIYDTLYPIVMHSPICKNENLLYGLLLHISNAVNKMKSGITDCSFKEDQYKIGKAEDYTCASQMLASIKQEYDIQLPPAEADYIATYLYLSSQWIDNRYIQLLIISENKDLAKDYADYLNSQKIKSKVHWLKMNVEDSEEIVMHTIIEKMKSINKEKGVVIATDNKYIESCESKLKTMTDIEFVMISNISVKLLLFVVEKIESLGVTIHTLKYFKQEETIKNTVESDQPELHAQELLNKITDKVLSESLVFLNPSKVCQSLFNVFINIIHDLNLDYADDLLIKFIFHSGFAIERCIRKEPLSYPKARTIINEFDKVYYAIDKNFEIISEIFNVTIPAAEMAMIMEIFLPYI